VALAAVYFFIWFPRPTFVVLVIFSLTGLERFFSKVYNFLEKK
jgi:hypothetical protein